MKFREKTLKKNHNVSEESDSSLFFRYVGFFIFIALSIYLLFFFFSFFVTRFISIEDEADFFGDEIDLDIQTELTDSINTLYPDFPYSLYVVDMDEEENAFAGLGGNIYLTKALLENTQYKNEIDFIIGHEIAHIENRDVIRSIISSLPTYLFLSLLGNSAGATIFDALIGNPHGKFQESKADIIGLEYTMKINGHTGCILDFFRKNNSLSDNAMTLFSGHPMTDARIQRVEDIIKQKGYPDGKCTLLSY